jgi:ribosomal-protein-alanine N-acetyltransferase
MSPVRVERMTSADVEEVGALEYAIFHAAHGASRDVVVARFRDDFAGPLMRAWVARAEGASDAVGYLSALHAADELHVLNVATVPARRRAGIGQALVAAALDYARAARVRLLVLEVRAANRDAIRLYRRAGFAAMSVRRRYYDDGDDALEMHLELDPSTGTIVPRADDVTLD